MRTLSALFVCLSIAVVSIAGCSRSTSQSQAKPLSAPKAALQFTPATCGGGPSATPVTMTGPASQLANMVVAYRSQAGLPVVSPNAATAGVAQWHASDMGKNEYVGLVGSDGEDPFRRIICSGGLNVNGTGVVAIGYTTDTNAALKAMQSDYSANTVLLYNTAAWTKIGVGYSNGYWMVILTQ